MSRDSIADLVHRYADAVVRRDREQWAATWADDSSWKLGPGMEVEGKVAIVEFWERAMSSLANVSQNVFNGTVAFDGDTATGRWYIVEFLKPHDGDARMMLSYYDDRYVNVDSQWLFASRELIVQYAGPPDLSAWAPGGAG